MPNTAYLNVKYDKLSLMNSVYDSPLTITSLEDNNNIYLKAVTNTSWGNYSPEVYVSLDGGMTWTQKLSPASTIAELDTGESVMIRCTYNGLLVGKVAIASTGHFNASGNPFSMYDGDNFNKKNQNGTYIYDTVPETDALLGLFEYSDVIDASGLILKPSILKAQCYAVMFRGCELLTNAPELPATTLANYCYYGMFYGCISLIQCPELPATTLKQYCYMNMFYGCLQLVGTCKFPATTLNSSCYRSMFEGCTRLRTVEPLNFNTAASSCCNSMFKNCTSLVNPPKLPATTLATNCYSSMFEGCASLTVAPDLLATTLVYRCYYEMFKGCTNLNYIKILATSRESESITNWTGPTPSGVAPSGVFVKASTATYTIDSVDGVPLGWTVYDEGDWIMDMYTLTLNVSESYTGTVSGGGSYKKNSTVIAVALPERDYVFSHWQDENGTVVSYEQSYMFKITSNVTLTAVFEEDDLDYEHEYFTIKSLEDNNEVEMSVYPGESYVIYYSYNYGTWHSMTLTCGQDEESKFVKIYTLNTKDKLRLGSNKTAWTPGRIWTIGGADPRIRLNKAYNVSGNLYSMIAYSLDEESDGDSFYCDALATIPDNCFRGFFSAARDVTYSQLTNASKLIVNCDTVGEYAYAEMFNGQEKLMKGPALPATTLAKRCYYGMFSGCILLHSSSTLPATTLAEGCYKSMFYRCHLYSMPLLPATTLAERCYEDMFAGCKSLNIIPYNTLPATTLAPYCYSGMFSGTDLAEIPILSVTTLAEGCYEGMFAGCESLNIIPYNMLPATTLAPYCYAHMFQYCTSLTSSPLLPATTFVTGCYEEMFDGCSVLNYIACNIADASDASTCCFNWVQHVASSGTFYKNENASNWAIDNISGIPIGWTVHNLEYIPEFYTVTFTPSDSEMGSVTFTQESGTTSNEKYSYGSQLKVTAVPASNAYEFTGTISGNNNAWHYDDFPNTFYINVYEDLDIIVYFRSKEINYSHQYFTIESESNNNIVEFRIYRNEDFNIYTSKNNGSWTAVNTKQYEFGGANYLDIVLDVLNGGDTLRLGTDASTLKTPDVRLQANKYHSVYGNIMSLICYGKDLRQTKDDFYYDTTNTVIPEGCFAYFLCSDTNLTSITNLIFPSVGLSKSCFTGFFRGCQSLTTVPSNLLPATTLAEGCYAAMFYGCKSLTTVPSNLLPATTLAPYCYQHMFDVCTSLNTIPYNLLPATTLAEGCYAAMFQFCTSLTTAPNLPATTLAPLCYLGMFNECKLTTAPNLPATTLAPRCYSGMFGGCKSLTTVPSNLLPATTLAPYCYEEMFHNCKSLTTAPNLPATTLVDRCYEEMFMGCTNLNSIRCYATSFYTNANNATINWLYGVSDTGTMYLNSTVNQQNIYRGPSGVPVGWTIETLTII